MLRNVGNIDCMTNLFTPKLSTGEHETHYDGKDMLRLSFQCRKSIYFYSSTINMFAFPDGAS